MPGDTKDDDERASHGSSRENLLTYLNDHLAGSVGALELLDHQIAERDDADMKTFLQALRDDIEADQTVLKELLRQAGGKESAVRQAGAWVAEKLGRAKLGGADHELGFMQALEMLSVGIYGKRALWRTLSAAATGGARSPGADYARLEERAEEQLARVEGKILELAPTVLS